MTNPLLGLLLDVDGPLASPLTRTITIPSIVPRLVRLANAGVPIAFNTGRSVAFVDHHIAGPLIGAGLDSSARAYGVCEKGALRFRITESGLSEVEIDSDVAVSSDIFREIAALVARSFESTMFFDREKKAMISVEQRVDVDSETFWREQRVFDAHAEVLLVDRGYGFCRLGVETPDASGNVQYRIDPTFISTDIESVALGKDRGASRALELIERDGPVPTVWRTVGDSRSDYAMADWLHERGFEVEHLDVRPAEGIPAKPYGVLVADDLIHDQAGALYLDRWANEFA